MTRRSHERYKVQPGCVTLSDAAAAVQTLAELKMMCEKAPLVPAEEELARQRPSWSFSSVWERKTTSHRGLTTKRERERRMQPGCSAICSE